MPTVLMLHQSAELYGSDRVALNVAGGLVRAGFEMIAILPQDGPLLPALRTAGVECHVAPVGKVARSDLSLSGILTRPLELARGLNAIGRALGGRRPDLVYSNTLAVTAGAVWAKLRGVKHLWHVHEIVLRPRMISRLYPLALQFLADRVVCNSTATRGWLVGARASLADRSAVVWNGVDETGMCCVGTRDRIRANLGYHAGDIVIALVGRINDWKGQEVLVEAAELLWTRGRRDVRFLIVGGPPPGQPEPLERLHRMIARSPVRDAIQLLDFTRDIAGVWEACDVAVVPSTAPEPFGLVAVEAMAAVRPVVAARHGGVLDIVEEEVTGLFVTPGDAPALAEAIARLADDAGLRTRMGRAGQARQRRLFSAAAQAQAIASICRALVQ
jgi:glycosyltransferase involved in cell wall biosynthesis